MTDAIAAALKRISDGAPHAIGVSAAGPLDLVAGSVVSPPNLPYDRIDLVGPLDAAFGVPVALINDARAGALGEHAYGAGRGCRDMVYVTISTGIGGGVIAGRPAAPGPGRERGRDRAYHGRDTARTASAAAATRTTGRPTARAGTCRGSTRSRRRPAIPAYSTAEAIFTAARADEPAARRFLETVAVLNARALSTLVVAYDPERIVLDGAVVRAQADLLVGPAVARMEEFLPRPKS